MKTLIPRTARRNGWRVGHLIGVMAMTALGVAVTSDAWIDIYHLVIRDIGFHHIYLVPFAVLLLIWARRGRLRLCRPAGVAIGPCFIAAGWALSSMGYHNAIESFWHFGSLLVVVGCALTILGRDALVYFVPAFVALAFVVPVPGAMRQWLAPQLASCIAISNEWLLGLLGTSITPPESGLVNGAERTTGAIMRVFFALELTTFTFVFTLPLTGAARAAFLVVSPLLSVGCVVVVSVLTTGLAMAFPDATDNLQALSAWIMLSVALLMLRAMIRALRWAMVPVTRFTLALE